MAPDAARVEFGPVAAQERLVLIDVLRGLAMFGVLWSNLNDWYGGIDSHWWPELALGWTQEYLVESRFYSLLAFLFGIGFAIQIARAELRGSDVRKMFYRRLSALLAFGIFHGMLIWRGDILTAYALVGFVLVLFHRLSARWLLVAAAANLALVPYVLTLLLDGFAVHYPAALKPEQIDLVYEHGSFAQIIAEGRRAYLYWYLRWPPIVFPPFLSLFLLGMWAVRVDLLKRVTARRGTIARVLMISLATSVAGVILLVLLRDKWPQPQLRVSPADAMFYVRSLRLTAFRAGANLTIWCGSVVYAAALALMISYPTGARRLQPLAAVGRMSLTTYLTQSLVSVTLFYHYGLGWYGHVGYVGKLAITSTLFAGQMVASAWWLRRHRFGPMEWLWRSIAYRKRQAMRRRPEPESMAAAQAG